MGVLYILSAVHGCR